MGTDWVVASDESVRQVWECRNDDCTASPQSTAVAPTFYGDKGIPVCPECGADMTYVRTEILVPKGIVL